MAEPCITNEKVIRSFVLSEKLKAFCEHNSFDETVLRQKILELHNELSNCRDLLSKIDDTNRRQRFSKTIWYHKIVELEKCWVWLHMGQNQNAFKTVLDAASAFLNCEDKVAKFLRIRSCLNIIEQECPLIVFGPPGIHDSYDKFRRSIFEYYDIDDGNHRAIAAFFAGKKCLPAFVGLLKK